MRINTLRFFFNSFLAISVQLYLCSCNNQTSYQTIDKEEKISDTLTNVVESEPKKDIVKYDEVNIGRQVWMKKNLDVSNFSNGDRIVEVKSEQEWEKACSNKVPAWCNYSNSSELGIRYGKLYNYFAVHDSRGLAPKGWRIPKLSDWEQMFKFICSQKPPKRTVFENECVNSELDTYSVGGELCSIDFWRFSENHNNNTGFTALPGGCRLGFDGNNAFDGIQEYGSFWTLDKKYDNYSKVTIGLGLARLEWSGFKMGLYVRCIKE